MFQNDRSVFLVCVFCTSVLEEISDSNAQLWKEQSGAFPCEDKDKMLEEAYQTCMAFVKENTEAIEELDYDGKPGKDCEAFGRPYIDPKKIQDATHSWL